MKRILEVQKEIGALSKKSTNPFFTSQYLDLNDLLAHVTPLLHKQGLILIQPIQDGIVCSEIWDAESGKKLTSSGIALPNIDNPQKLGSAITYYRRYTLKSLLAIAEKDDDGNGASKEPTENEVIVMIGNCKTKPQLQKLKALIAKHGLNEIANVKLSNL